MSLMLVWGIIIIILFIYLFNFCGGGGFFHSQFVIPLSSWINFFLWGGGLILTLPTLVSYF